ncbi:MAG TPA: ATP-binding protein [Thermodesulfobacteriota bacterium]|nr:ATP-binding protein [Thermodesulfobacteriota bacterium]
MFNDSKNLSKFLVGRKKFPQPIQKVFHWVGKAISQFQMIEDGDRIAVGVSGIDSLSVLWILRERLKWISVKYEIKPIYVDLGFDGDLTKIITDYLKSEVYDYKIITTDIGLKAHSPVNYKNPCFFCSRERRKKLFTLAKEMKCNKIAFGHHLEDINATLFLNILYGSSISTMLPRQDFFGGKLTIIRPFALVPKEQIQKLANFAGIPPIVNPCPSAQTSQRKQVDEFLNYFYKKDRRIRYNIFNAMQNINRDYLPRSSQITSNRLP